MELFYGKNPKTSLRWHAKLEEQLLWMKNHPLPEPYRHSLHSPTTFWKVFYRQQEALDFASQDPVKDLKVFSYESDTVGSEGQRLYLVASYDQFCHYYMQPAMQGRRHHYEVIAEGIPCKLYFDLEFSKSANQNLDGVQATHIFKQYVIRHLKTHFEMVCNVEAIIDLDSSSSTKFSRHLIFACQELVFSNNIEAGNFVRHVCQYLKLMVAWPSTEVGGQGSEGSQDRMPLLTGTAVLNGKSPLPCTHCSSVQLHDLDLSVLVVLNKDRLPTLFCDLSVYTKNRNFRLYLSSKLGKTEVLSSLSCSDESVDMGCVAPAASREQIFFDSLVTNVRMGRVLRTFSADSETLSHSGYMLCIERDKLPAMSGAQQSPFVEVDAFVARFLAASSGSRPGAVRRWQYFPDSETLVYDVAHNRWCERLQREHKSNNTMIIVKLRSGVFYRKCHDPECHTPMHKPTLMKLPVEVLPAFYFSDEFDDVGDSSAANSCLASDWDSLSPEELHHAVGLE